jgi:hypothetical protein
MPSQSTILPIIQLTKERPMSTILNEIIRHRARKLANAHIKRALDDLKYGGQFRFEDCEREIESSYWQQKSVDLVFRTAYDGQWHLLGGADALEGSRRFDVPAYLQGWRNQIMALSFDGWVNPRIIQQSAGSMKPLGSGT